MLESGRYAGTEAACDSSVNSVGPDFPITNLLHHGPDGGDAERKAPVLMMPAPPRKISRWQRWRYRLFLVEFVFVCLMIGVLLITAPWTPYWSDNSLLAGFPRVHELLMNDFVRGLISGLGVIDVWLAISEAVHYREYPE